MSIGSGISKWSVKHYRATTWIMIAVTLLILLSAGLPSLKLIPGMPGWVRGMSESLSFLPTIAVDTDPENMLSEDEPVRIFHDRKKEQFTLHDMVVVGIVNEEHPQGVFNPQTLAKIKTLTDFVKGLRFDERGRLLETPAERAPDDVEATTPADASEPSGIEGLDGEPAGIEGLDMPAPGGEEPDTAAAPRAPPKPTPPDSDPSEQAKLRGVIPQDVIAPSTVDAITPQQGAILFEWLMRTPPETQAQAAAIRDKARRVPFLDGTLLSEDGRAVCIYVPITSKDLSYGVYTALQEKVDQLPPGPEEVHITGLPVAEDTFGVQMFLQMAISAPAAMAVIFLLMLVFFRKIIVVLSPMVVAMVSVIVTMGSLILAGFPIHIMSSMIPIFIMPIAVLDSIHIISDFFEKYQQTRDRQKTILAVVDDLFMPMLYTSLTSAAGFASLALTPIPPVQVFGVFVAAGILVAWFLTVTFIPAFVMFIPDRMLKHFGAKHTSQEDEAAGRSPIHRFLRWMGGLTYRRAKPILAVTLLVLAVAGYGISLIRVNDNPVKWFEPDHPIRTADRVLNDHFGGTYMAYLSMEADENAGDQPFKQPEVLRWQRNLQDAMLTTGVVGKSNSLADIVRTVHRDLLADSPDDPKIDEYFRVPDSRGGVAECLMQFQSSHRNGDIDKFVTPDYRNASLWVQLTSGDNMDMERVVRHVRKFIGDNPPPVPLRTKWFGLTYINVIWQDKMVLGMLEAFAGSFLVVFLLMTILFRSPLWGILSMVPLTVTIAGIYGAVGLVGKNYDMPVAVLSSLTLGLAVDFAIHFLARGREMVRRYGSWEATAPHVFGEPAMAITRNIIVIAAGFTPLLLAPLVPYQTVGILLATILLASGVATLLILPAMIRLLQKWLFGDLAKDQPLAPSCNCGLCVIASVTAVVLLAMNFYSAFGWGVLTWVSVAAIPGLALLCGVMSRRRKCKTIKENQPQPKEGGAS
jgi:uncharacterized protein